MPRTFLDRVDVALKFQEDYYKHDRDEQSRIWTNGYCYKFWDAGRLIEERQHVEEGLTKAFKRDSCAKSNRWEFKALDIKPEAYYNRIFGRKTFDIKKIYYDCSGSNIVAGDRRIISFYTPHGVSMIDAQLGTRIREYGSGDTSYSYKQLREMVLRNPHLHDYIKANLYYNLVRVNEEIKYETVR